MEEVFYEKAIQHPLFNHSLPGHLSDKNTIVLHITDGSTASGAISWFEQSQSPNRISAHFVIDRNGDVYQLLPISAVAWHASQCNYHSIGIEHAGSAKLPCTPEQYAASAALIAWICQQTYMTCDRQHIRSHNEASPRDHHIGCCTDGLDPDKVVTEAQAALINMGIPT